MNTGSTSPRRIPPTTVLAVLTTALLFGPAVGCGGGDEEQGAPTDPPPAPDVQAPEQPSPSADRAAEVEATPPGAEPEGPAAEDAPEEPPADPEPAAAPAPVELTPEVSAALAAIRALRTDGRPEDAADLARTEEKALGAHAALRLECAWAYFDQAVTEFDRGADKFLVKGLLADAHLRLDQALDLDPGVPTAPLLLARLLRYEEDPDGAKQVLRDHLAAATDDIGCLKELGDMEYSARNWQAADVLYTKAAVLDPEDGISRLRATIAKQWLGTPADVLLPGYLRAAELLPEHNDPLKLLAGLYPNRPDRGIGLLDQVIEANPAAVWARVWKAHLMGRLAEPDLEACLAVLQEALDLAPEHAAVRINTAELLERMERPLEALDQYLWAVRLAEVGAVPVAADAVDRLLFTKGDGGFPAKKRFAAWDLITARYPTIGRYGNNAGFWCREAKEYDRSVRYYEASVKAQPDDQDYLNDTGLIYLYHLPDRRQKCMPLFERVIELVEVEGQEPIRGYWDTLENLCKYWFEEGEYGRVLELAEKRARNTSYPSGVAARFARQARKALGEGGSREK